MGKEKKQRSGEQRPDFCFIRQRHGRLHTRRLPPQTTPAQEVAADQAEAPGGPDRGEAASLCWRGVARQLRQRRGERELAGHGAASRSIEALKRWKESVTVTKLT
ncbi:hypothetical protein NL676_038232 [Syzygium grande]|nr:hypothetical protein NL676_038232 [Syzygium grande]